MKRLDFGEAAASIGAVICAAAIIVLCTVFDPAASTSPTPPPSGARAAATRGAGAGLFREPSAGAGEAGSDRIARIIQEDGR